MTFCAALFAAFPLEAKTNDPKELKTIVFIGDSLTEGYEIDPDSTYVALLEKKWAKENRHVKVVNGSVSGSTTSSAMPRLRWFEKLSPDLVVLALGANDGLRGIELSTSRANLEQAIKWAADRSIHVILAGMMLPPNYGEIYTEEFRKMFLSLAKEHENVTLIPFLLEGVAAIPKMNLPDGIHPNEEGHKVMMNTVARYIEPLL